MRDYDEIKRELDDREGALKRAEAEQGPGAELESLRDAAAHLRLELYEHPRHPATTEGQVDNDQAGEYPRRVM